MRIEKLGWSDAKIILHKANPELCKIVDDIDYTKKEVFYLISYPYGKIIADHKHGFQYPSDQFGYIYDKIIPFSVVTNKSFEMFIEMGGKSFCYRIYDKGSMFHTVQFLERGHKYEPVDILKISSGAKNTFLLPKISDAIPNKNLSKHFNRSLRKPTNLDDHFFIFRDMAESVNLDWTANILCFSKKWVEKTKKKKPTSFYNYINFYNNKFDVYSRCIPLYNFVLSYIRTQDSRIPNNTFIHDVIREFFRVGCMQSPGYAPVTNDDFLPYKFIAKSYLDIYKLDSIPFAMAPSMMTGKDVPVYYSFAKESLTFKPHKFASTLQTSLIIKDSFNAIANYMDKYDIYPGTEFRKCADHLEIEIFNARHNTEMQDQYLNTIADLFAYDSRYKRIANKLGCDLSEYNSNSPFFTGSFGLKIK